ncbi:tripartite tricarboxylate transporter TctB family protein [Acuticoccus sp. M5D2P5]|uniref:tripartite tricarboxylate transporter TctB family protein n=1 Tax=Acuticoccus kalidii TaxID=2910977 RepID=UPI001F1C9678|nr:tripartite tricarboxylate transporter TctB family protein [Acuticoccus kalidii]MCF3936686.1 tripartite tricarboxylate transporter TctB family protein [Acuticoccus kalidii]
MTELFGASRTPRGDVALSLAVLALAGIMWWQALKIPPPFFDPLGSAVVPKSVAIALALFAAIMLLRALNARPWPARERETGYRPRPDIAAGIFLLAAAYVGAMALGLLSFEIATILFLAAGTALLARFERRTVLLGAAIALLLGIGGTLLFTHVFYIDLPR